MSENNLTNIVLVLLLSIFLIIQLNGQSIIVGESEQIGTSVANFLKIGVGGRALGMGEAYVALASDASGLYWNPGGLDRSGSHQFIAQNSNWLAGSKIKFVGGIFNMGTYGTIGASAYYFSSGPIEETTLNSPNGTGRTVTANDLSLGISYSKSITDRFSAGMTIKIVSEQLASEKASTIALDIGSIFRTNFLRDLLIGMSLSNLGGQMSFRGSGLSVQYSPTKDFSTKIIRADLMTEEYELPLFFRFGVATDLLKSDQSNLIISTEFMDSRDYIHRIAFGTEYGFRDKAFLRGGYRINTDEESFTIGGGINVNVAGTDIQFDYAYGDFGVFEATQRFSLVMSF